MSTNVFDLMVPAAATAPAEEKLLGDRAPLVLQFIDALAAHAGEGELFGLVKKFEAAHLTDKLESWIGRGEYAPLAEEEVQSVLGDEFLTELEKMIAAATDKTSQPADHLLADISVVLPVVVKRIAGAGQIPPQRILQRNVDDFRKSLLSKYRGVLASK